MDAARAATKTSIRLAARAMAIEPIQRMGKLKARIETANHPPSVAPAASAQTRGIGHFFGDASGRSTRNEIQNPTAETVTENRMNRISVGEIDIHPAFR